MLTEMVSVRGRHLFVLPTTELITDKLQDLNRQAALSGTEPVIRAIHSRVADGRSVSISREIADAIEEYPPATPSPAPRSRPRRPSAPDTPVRPTARA
jgi:hypothetical protein